MKKKYTIEFDKLTSSLCDVDIFETYCENKNTYLINDDTAYKAKITLFGCEIPEKTVEITKTCYTDCGIEMTYSDLSSGKENKAVFENAEGELTVYDLRPLDAESEHDTVCTWLHEAGRIIELFGENVFSEEEKELLKVESVFYVLDADAVRFIDEKYLSKAAEYLKSIDDPLLAPLEKYIFSKRNSGEIKALSNLRKAISKSTLKEKLTRELLPLCNSFNEKREPHPLFDRKKYEALSALLQIEAEKNGYTGAFPRFEKGEKYIELSPAHSTYEEKGQDFVFDLGASFGIKNKKAFLTPYGGKRLVFKAMEMAKDEKELEKAACVLLSSLDLILDGKNPPEVFYTFVEKHSYDRSWQPLMTALGLIIGAFGAACCAGMLFVGETTVPSILLGSVALGIFLFLFGVSIDFGIRRKKRPKFLFKTKK